jgi:hypothetical protein
VGYAALSLGVIGLVGLALLVAWLGGASVPAVLPGVYVAQDEFVAHRSLTLVAGFGNGFMSLLLSGFGLGLLRRGAWSLPLGMWWGRLTFPWALFGAWVGWLNLMATDRGMNALAPSGTPLAVADTARITGVTGVVFGAALSWALAFAVLAWLRYAREMESAHD